MRDELIKQGYEAALDVTIGDARADLIATRGPDKIIYEFKATGGVSQDGWVKNAALLQNEARKAAAQFKLIVVSPQRKLDVDIEGLEEMLADALKRDLPAELEGITANTIVEEVYGVELDHVKITKDLLVIVGAAEVGVTLLAGDGSMVDTCGFPFEFKAELNMPDQQAYITESSFDLTGWYGPPDE